MTAFVFQPSELDQETIGFYKDVLKRLSDAKIPYLVGGAYALAAYAGIVRHTKDLDIFARPRDRDAILETLRRAGYRTEVTYSVWLAKAFSRDAFVDVIYRSGNGICEVDDEWFAHAAQATILDIPVKLCPPEESLWSKAFIMERERFDGADIAHYILSWGPRMDWERLLRRFGEYWRVLLAHLILFGFAYPGRRSLVPKWVMDHLMSKLQSESGESPSEPGDLCRGTILSRTFYLIDVGPWGFTDGRFIQYGTLTEEGVQQWRAEVEREKPALLSSAGISLADSSKSQMSH